MGDRPEQGPATCARCAAPVPCDDADAVQISHHHTRLGCPKRTRTVIAGRRLSVWYVPLSVAVRGSARARHGPSASSDTDAVLTRPCVDPSKGHAPSSRTATSPRTSMTSEQERRPGTCAYTCIAATCDGLHVHMAHAYHQRRVGASPLRSTSGSCQWIATVTHYG